MQVQELIDILKDQPPEAEVELAIVAPIDSHSDQITVDRYDVVGVMPWDGDDDGVEGVWLISAREEDDVELFLDALEDDAEED